MDSKVGVIDKGRSIHPYQARLEVEKVKQISRAESIYSVTFRVNQWLKVLSNEDAFDKFFNIDKKDKPKMFKKMDTSKLERYTLYLDGEYFPKFTAIARKNKMSANYALNVILDRYCETGNLFEIKIWV